MSAAKEFTNGTQTVKLYTVKQGDRFVYQLSYYRGGLRYRHTYVKYAKAKAESRLTLSKLASPTLEVEAISTPEIESMVVAQKHLAPLQIPLHVAAETLAAAAKIIGNGESITPGRIIEACEFFAKHCPKAKVRKPIAQLAEDFVKSRESMGLSIGYIDQCRMAVRAFFKIIKPTDTELPSFEALQDWVKKRYPHPVTRNTNMIVLKVFGNWLVETEQVAFNPFAKIKKSKVVAEPVVIYTPDEFKTLLGSLRPNVRVFAALGAFSGLRRAEIQRLEWQDINFDRGFITVAAHKAKTQARRLVPIAPNLRQWLEPARKTEGMVAAHDGSYVAALFRKAGATEKRNALRHSYISYRVAELQDTAKVALEAGNSPEMIFRHYRELVAPNEAKAWFDITPNDVPKFTKQLRAVRKKALPAPI